MTKLSPIAGLVTMVALLATLSAQAAFAESTPAAKAAPSELFLRIGALDRDVFSAFNDCNIAKLESYFSPELEFYHDKTGLSQSRDQFIDAVRKNVCGKFRRELVAGTLEVWPLGNYGAVYTGTHLFCHTGAAKCEGIGRFLHIWQNKDGKWIITRVVSYDHKAAP